jgi:hypothetical protein
MSLVWEIGCFGRTYCLHLQGRKIRVRGTSVSRWLELLLDLYSNPSKYTMALGSTQPLTEMSTRNLPVG